MAKAKECFYATGRRKSASARVYATPVKSKEEAKIVVNGKPINEYFGRPTSVMVALMPLEVTSTMGRFSINVNVGGSGNTGQAGAISHGIARALVKYEEAAGVGSSEAEEGASTLKSLLRKAGHLTRDARKVERKKPGFRKARKSEQYSKR